MHDDNDLLKTICCSSCELYGCEFSQARKEGCQWQSGVKTIWCKSRPHAVQISRMYAFLWDAATTRPTCSAEVVATTIHLTNSTDTCPHVLLNDSAATGALLRGCEATGLWPHYGCAGPLSWHPPEVVLPSAPNNFRGSTGLVRHTLSMLCGFFVGIVPLGPGYCNQGLHDLKTSGPGKVLCRERGVRTDWMCPVPFSRKANPRHPCPECMNT